MINADIDIPVVIVGGGPVGIFLGICLQTLGIRCRVLEKRMKPVSDSRSLGIHPVSLELFDELGITNRFLEKGLKVNRGIALTKDKTLGEISFTECPRPHNYVLICPQYFTEEIFRNTLMALDDEALITGAGFLVFEESGNIVTTKYSRSNGGSAQITSNYLVGCDGKNSIVRRQASIHYSGKRYSDTYIMGDFEDTTDLGAKAAIFLPKPGLVESFPLPENMRRWVVKTDSFLKNPDKHILAEIVKNRTGYNLNNSNNTMMSSFGVQHFMAEFFVKGRILLAGDSAHVVSPIGGQGMNLGWLGAWKLAQCFARVYKNGDDSEAPFKEYESQQKRVVRKAARRAEINMKLGRKRRFPVFRNLIIHAMLNTPLSKRVARLFTMRGLDSWWI